MKFTPRRFLFGAALATLLAGSFVAWAQGIQIITRILNGTEVISLDYPCTVSCGIQTSTLIGSVRASVGGSNFVNAIIGGDYTTNPFQRGTSNGTAHISNTVTYGPADQWFVGASTSSIDWSQNTSSAPTRYGASLTMQRTSGNTDVNPIYLGQVLSSAESVRFQNNQAMVEVWAQSCSGYTGGAVTVTLGLGTGSNQSSVNFAAGTWTNYAAAVPTSLAAFGYQAANSFTPTATWTRYVMAFAVPTTLSGSAVNQLGIKMGWTPSGTAGASDCVNIAAWQLEVNNTNIPSAFDHRPPSIEFVRAAKFFQALNEPAAGINVATGVVPATNTTCQVVLPLVDEMFAAPTVSFAGTTLSASTWKAQTASQIALSTPFLAAGSGNTAAQVNLTATLASASTSGFGCALQGAGGGGKIWISAEL